MVGRFSREQNLPYLDKSKFLVPQEVTMSQFVSIIRYYILKYENINNLFLVLNLFLIRIMSYNTYIGRVRFDMLIFFK